MTELLTEKIPGCITNCCLAKEPDIETTCNLRMTKHSYYFLSNSADFNESKSNWDWKAFHVFFSLLEFKLIALRSAHVKGVFRVFSLPTHAGCDKLMTQVRKSFIQSNANAMNFDIWSENQSFIVLCQLSRCFSCWNFVKISFFIRWSLSVSKSWRLWLFSFYF